MREKFTASEAEMRTDEFEVWLNPDTHSHTHTHILTHTEVTSVCFCRGKSDGLCCGGRERKRTGTLEPCPFLAYVECDLNMVLRLVTGVS